MRNLRAQSRTKATAAWQPDYCFFVVAVVAAALIVGSIVLASFELAVGLVKELAAANLSVECHYNDLVSCCAEKYATLFIKSATTEQQQKRSVNSHFEMPAECCSICLSVLSNICVAQAKHKTFSHP